MGLERRKVTMSPELEGHRSAFDKTESPLREKERWIKDGYPNDTLQRTLRRRGGKEVNTWEVLAFKRQYR